MIHKTDTIECHLDTDEIVRCDEVKYLEGELYIRRILLD